MKIENKVVVVTGAARGIGRAMARRFAAEKPRALIIADLDRGAAEELAREIGGPASAAACDVSRESELTSLIQGAIRAHGRIDLFCSNAGIGVAKGVEARDEEWLRLWHVNLMSHVWAVRALLAGPVEDRPYLVITASAAGLLAMIGDAPYTVTKHAAVALAEWLAVEHEDRLRVSCLCPLFVNTDLLKGALSSAAGATIPLSGRVIEAEEVAEAVVAGIDAEKFLILPHPEVASYFQKKAGDHDRWIGGMRKLKRAKQ